MDSIKAIELISEIPAEQRKAVLKLIDLKTNQDMKEVINSINLLKENIKHLEDKNAERSKTLYWVLGVIVAIMVALKLFG